MRLIPKLAGFPPQNAQRASWRCQRRFRSAFGDNGGLYWGRGGGWGEGKRGPTIPTERKERKKKREKEKKKKKKREISVLIEK